MNSKQYYQANERRHALLCKQCSEGLTDEEGEELIKITEDCTEYVHKKYPLDWSALEELEAKVKKQESWLNRFIKKWRK